MSRFCSIYFTVTLAGLKDIVRYTKDLYKGLLNRGSTVLAKSWPVNYTLMINYMYTSAQI